ncbi:hypothetical protein F2P81_024068 [Scophthalmus maximus]|uniref:Uncharacterized protein n=1 Tax=Scophthalmus maximus TaxID=52904 RepID=A0A6A4RTU0_SCOMX|nr:hypothetical protein F2P81_024068 [Scophthalmus maximus]
MPGVCFGTFLAVSLLLSLLPSEPPPPLDCDNGPGEETVGEASPLPRWTVTTAQVKRQLERLHPRKAAGPVGISHRVLKTCASQLCAVLHHLFNLILSLEQTRISGLLAEDRHHVACQTDPPVPPQTNTVGTQLSITTFQPHFRSKGTQKTISCASVGTSPVAFSTSKPFMTSTAVKRPRLELEEEEDNPLEGSSSMKIPDPQDSTYDPEDSFTALTVSVDVTKESTDPVHKTSTYIVYESCLLELFRICPECRRVSEIFRAMHLKMFQYDTFRRHARNYIEPAIVHKWKKAQGGMLEQLSEQQNVILGGDLRADLHGHSAKFGTYSMMDLKSNTIIDLQLVQSNEVDGSYHMEKEGLKRSLALLEAHGVTMDSIVTDPHPQIQKFLRESNITHNYNVWHMEKDLAHGDPVFPQCLHPEHTSRDKSKNVVFTFLEMLCSLYLAALHFNENAGLPKARTSAGEPQYRMYFPKPMNGEVTAKPVKTAATFCYVDELMDLIFDVFKDPAPFMDEVLRIPIPPALSTQFDSPEKQDVVASFVSGFNQAQV